MSESLTAASPAGAPFDELRDDEGLIRPHWRPFARALDQISPEEYERRQAAARATVRDNGVTYNVYDESAGQARPWQLDIVPFILSQQDWKAIEAAIIQRAELAELLPGLQTTRVQDAGHMIPWDDEEGFYRAFGDFLGAPLRNA